MYLLGDGRGDQRDFRAGCEQAPETGRRWVELDPREFETAENKLLVLEGLIDQKILALAARRSGIVVSDAVVRKVIAEEPAFQVGGKFDPSQYALMLSSQTPAMSPVEFQNKIRQGMQEELVPEGIRQSDFITTTEFARLVKLLFETRDVTIAAIPAPPVDAAAAVVTDAQAKAWYDSHPGDFKQGESVTLEYVEVDGSKLPAATAPLDDAALRKRYEQEKARFVSAEQRLASHILITVAPDADAATRKAAGTDFAALAKANTQDPGSRDSGGDLGWVEKGVMVKPFEDALFAMQAGEIRGPVRTDFGYHVMQLREIKAGQGKSFEEVRDDLAREQGEADGERAYNELAGRLVNEVLRNPTALGPAARTVGLPVQRIGPFSRATASGIAANPAVLRAAFLRHAGTGWDSQRSNRAWPHPQRGHTGVEHTPEQPQPWSRCATR